jgi:hypothetical protein
VSLWQRARGYGEPKAIVRASRGIPKWLRITSLIVSFLAGTLAAVQDESISRTRTISALASIARPTSSART